VGTGVFHLVWLLTEAASEDTVAPLCLLCVRYRADCWLQLRSSCAEQHDAGSVTAPSAPWRSLSFALRACRPPWHELCLHLCVTVCAEDVDDDVMLCASCSCACVVQLLAPARSVAWAKRRFRHVEYMAARDVGVCERLWGKDTCAQFNMCGVWLTSCIRIVRMNYRTMVLLPLVLSPARTRL
jgi:hypothetical protein